MRNLLVVFVLLLTMSVVAQERGIVTGVVTDNEMNNETLPFANVFIKGTTIGTTTDFDGNYTLSLKEGDYVIVFSFVGYTASEKTITVKAGQNYTINQGIGASEGVLMDEVIVRAIVSRESASALLSEQKKAVEMVVAIGAQELSRKGVSNIAVAVTKMAGISKQEGTGAIFVRGLGDRYNFTTLNGLPLPSNNPSAKNIDLNIFSTDLVESVDISKTYSVKNYGDFGGANINIGTKVHSGKGYVEVKLGAGVNSSVLDVSTFYLQDGPSASGFGKMSIPSDPLTPYNYSTSWDRVASDNKLNKSFGISAGKSFDIGEQGRMSAFFTASHNSSNNFRTGVSRGGVNVQGVADSDYLMNTYLYNTNTTVMGSLEYRINSNNQLSFVSMFLNSTQQNYSEYEGRNNEFDGGVGAASDEVSEHGIIQRGTYDQTRLFVNQLLGTHTIGENQKIYWELGISKVESDTPDRMQNTFVYSRVNDDEYTFFSNSAIYNHRFYQFLEENEYSANISYDFKFAKDQEEEYKGKFTVGYSGRYKLVDYNSSLFWFKTDENAFNFEESDIHHVDSYLNDSNFEAGLYEIKENPQSYSGNQSIQAVFARTQYQFDERLTVVLGLRGEMISQYIEFVTTQNIKGDETSYDQFEFLPSLSAKYSLSEKHNLKFASSKSYTLPQFKEKVEMRFEEVTQVYVGNKDLYSSTNYNVDFGWEFYPKTSEIISITSFGKIIMNPINEMFLNSSAGEISYANTGGKATVYGVEVEFRKDLFSIEGDDDLQDKVTFGANATFMKSDQDLDDDKVSEENEFGVRFTYDNSSLTGASDILVNTDISYFKQFGDKTNITTTLAFLYFSDKIKTIGTSGKGHLVDQSNQSLDLIIKSEIGEHWRVSLAAKNILDPTYYRVQETQNVIVNSYKKGTSIGLSATYNF